jgi:hypothetical protein
MDQEVSMKKVILTLIAAAALAVAAPTVASADQPSNPGCFGEGVSLFVQLDDQHPVGQKFTSVAARRDDPNPGLGQDFIPTVRDNVFCP